MPPNDPISDKNRREVAAMLHGLAEALPTRDDSYRLHQGLPAVGIRELYINAESLWKQYKETCRPTLVLECPERTEYLDQLWASFMGSFRTHILCIEEQHYWFDATNDEMLKADNEEPKISLTDVSVGQPGAHELGCTAAEQAWEEVLSYRQHVISGLMLLASVLKITLDPKPNDHEPKAMVVSKQEREEGLSQAAIADRITMYMGKDGGLTPAQVKNAADKVGVPPGNRGERGRKYLPKEIKRIAVYRGQRLWPWENKADRARRRAEWGAWNQLLRGLKQPELDLPDGLQNKMHSL